MRIWLRRDFDGELVSYDLPALYEGQRWTRVSVSTALAYIQRHIDPTLSYAISCGRGSCNLCVIRVNGEVVTACTTPVAPDMVIEPTRQNHQIKDVVVEMSLVRKARVPQSERTHRL